MNYALLLSSALFLYAHSLSGQTFALGARGGYSFTNIHLSEIKWQDGLVPPNSTDPLHGFHAGLEGKMDFNQKWALLFGVQYSQKGFESQLFWPAGPASARNVFHYIYLPVVVDFQVWRGLSIQAGMEGGRLLGVRAISGGENVNINKLGIYRDFDFGLIAGLEYRIRRFFIGARQSWGIYDLYGDAKFTDENGFELGELKSFHRAAQISVGYRHPLP
ncbi:MAG: PorT family protein [Saprospiraceae bacterium]|nr:PorT family protein [Saprospiraceae bacterium]